MNNKFLKDNYKYFKIEKNDSVESLDSNNHKKRKYTENFTDLSQRNYNWDFREDSTVDILDSIKDIKAMYKSGVVSTIKEGAIFDNPSNKIKLGSVDIDNSNGFSCEFYINIKDVNDKRNNLWQQILRLSTGFNWTGNDAFSISIWNNDKIPWRNKSQTLEIRNDFSKSNHNRAYFPVNFLNKGWTHIVLTVDVQNKLRVYINNELIGGVLINSNKISNSIDIGAIPVIKRTHNNIGGINDTDRTLGPNMMLKYLRLYNNQIFSKSDVNNLYTNKESIITYSEKKRIKENIDSKNNKILSTRLDNLNKKKKLIKNRKEKKYKQEKLRIERINLMNKDITESKLLFNKMIKKVESKDNIFNLAHSYEFRMRDNVDSIYDQLNPNSMVKLENIVLDKYNGGIFNGVNTYGVTADEIPAHKEISIEIYVKVFRPNKEPSKSTIFNMVSKEKPEFNHKLSHTYKNYIETQQGYKGKTKDTQVDMQINNRGTELIDFNPSSSMSNGLNIDSFTHIVITNSSNGILKYYRDGLLIYTKNNNHKYTEVNSKIFFGIQSLKNYDPNFKDMNYIKMYLRYFRIYHKVLSVNQIKDLNNNKNDIYQVEKILNITKPLLTKLSASKKETGLYPEKDQFNEYLRKQTLPFYLLYTNPSSDDNRTKVIIYKRLSSIENVDMFTLFHQNWFDHNKGIKNTFNVDFELYSDLESAVNNSYRWTFCNFNDTGVGFPRDCGPTGFIPKQWISITKKRGYGWSDWSFSLYTISERQLFTQKLLKYNDKLIRDANKDKYLQYYNKKGLEEPILLSNYLKEGNYQEKDEFNEYLKNLPLPFYIIWENPIANDIKYRNIIYKRLTPLSLKEDKFVDMYDLLHINWFDQKKGIKNRFNKDFELYSDIDNAVNDKRVKKIKIVNNGHLQISEIQVWINGVNVVQNVGTYAIASKTNSPESVSKNAYNNVINHGNDNFWWKKIYYSQNMKDSFYTLVLDRSYPFDDIEAVIVYNVTKSDDDIRFTQSYLVLMDIEDNELTNRINNNNGNTPYHYYKYKGPSHDNNKNQSDTPSTEKMLNDNMQKLIEKSFETKKNRWNFCNFNEPGVGFMRDCGTHGKVGGQWMSITKDRGFGWNKWSFSVTTNKYQNEQKLYYENNEIIDEEKKIKYEMDIARKTNIDNKTIIEKRNKQLENNKNILKTVYTINGLSLNQITEKEKEDLIIMINTEILKTLEITEDKLEIKLFTGSIGIQITVKSDSPNQLNEKLDKFNNNFEKDSVILNYLKNSTGIDSLTSFKKVIQVGLNKKSTKPDPKDYDMHIKLPMFSKKFIGTFSFKSNTITDVRAICPSLILSRKYTDIGKFDSPNGNIGIQEDTDWHNCSKRCNEIKDCIGYVKNLKNTDTKKGCTYKKNINPFEMSESNDHRTYLVSNTYELVGNEDYPGNDIIKFNNSSINSCPTLCDKSPNCVGFVENTIDGKGCFLKKKLEKRVSDGKKTTYKKIKAEYEEIPFSKKTLTAGNTIWANREGVNRYDNPNSEKFTYTKLDSEIQTTWSSSFNYEIDTDSTKGIELFINNVSDDDDFYIMIDITKDSNGVYINDGGLIGQLESLNYISLGEDIAIYENGPFRTYKLKLNSSNKIKDYQKDDMFNKKTNKFNQIKIQQNRLSNIKISELQVWIDGKNIMQEDEIIIKGTIPMNPQSLVRNIKNNKLSDKPEDIYLSSFFQDSYLIVKLNSSYNFSDLEAIVTYIPENEKEKYTDNYIVLLDSKDNEVTEQIDNYNDNKTFTNFIYKGPSYEKNKLKSKEKSTSKILEENKESKTTLSTSFKIKNSIPLNNFISQSQRFGESKFGTRLFIYNQYKNKISYKMNVSNSIDGINYVTPGYNIITRLDNNELFINNIEYFLEENNQFYIGVKNKLPVPYGPLYESYLCGPNDPLCYPTPCRGQFTECNDKCEKTYEIKSKASLGGLKCSFNDGAIEKCNPGEGKCKKTKDLTLIIIIAVVVLLLIIAGFFIIR